MRLVVQIALVFQLVWVGLILLLAPLVEEPMSPRAFQAIVLGSLFMLCMAALWLVSRH